MNGRGAIGARLCAAPASSVLLMQDLRTIPGKDSDPDLSLPRRSLRSRRPAAQSVNAGDDL